MHRQKTNHLRKKLLGFIVLGIVFSNSANSQNIKSILPNTQQFIGWQISDSAKIYTGDDLFTLIDGGADLYIEYGFKEVVSCKYVDHSNSSLQMEIYEMASDSAAYGIFTTMQSDKGQSLNLGQGARLFDYYLVFWKGRYYVTITGSDQSVNTRKMLQQTAMLIDSNIKEKGKIPEWITILPREGLQEQKYIRGNIGLSNIYSFGAGNLFNVVEGTHGKYKGARVFVFRYDTEQTAEKQFKSASLAISKSALFTKFIGKPSDFVCADGSKNNITASLKGKSILIYIYTDKTEFKKLSKKI